MMQSQSVLSTPNPLPATTFPKKSASAANKLTFKKEQFADIIGELPDLFVMHWQEIALDHSVIPLAPDWQKYINLERSNQLHIVAARDNGVLVGYFFTIVLTHLHYCTTVMAWSDIMFLRPEYRRGFAGIRLVKEAEKMVRALGAKRLYIMCKVYHDIEGLLARLGYRWVEKIFTKLL